MKYNFKRKKKNLNRKNNATETKNTKKKGEKKRKTETILSYLTQHKTQRNLGGVRHMWKFKDAYIDLKKMYMFR